MIIFVTAVILRKQDDIAAFPGDFGEIALGLTRQAFGFASADTLDPDVKAVLPRRQKGEIFAVIGKRIAGSFRVTKEVLKRDFGRDAVFSRRWSHSGG